MDWGGDGRERACRTVVLVPRKRRGTGYMEQLQRYSSPGRGWGWEVGAGELESERPEKEG